MWRQAVVILLTAATVLPQEQLPTPSNATNEHKETRRVKVIPYYSYLRCGTTEDVALVFSFKTGFVAMPEASAPGTLPVTLEVESTPDLDVSKIQYPKEYKVRFDFQTGQISVYGAYDFPIRLRIHAAKNVPPGARTLKGRLTYQLVDKKGISEPQEMEVEIPVTIVDRHVHVQRAKNWPYTHIPAGEIVLIVVLSPILLPLGAVCVFLGGCA